MAGRELSLFLKYPGHPLELQRLQHSFLECVVEYKAGTDSQLQILTPAELHSEYQLKGNAMLVDDEIVLQFTPKHAGVHTVRIFADTRELCRPVAFIVNRNIEVESIPIDRPIRGAASSFMPSNSQADVNTAQQSQGQWQQQQYGGQRASMPPRPHPPPPSQFIAPSPHPQSVPEETMRGFLSDPLHQPHGAVTQQQQNRMSHISSQGGGLSRPTSMFVQNDPGFAGDLMTMKPDQNTFDQLFMSKQAGNQTYGKKRGFLTVDHSHLVTPETFQNLRKDITVAVSGDRGKVKRRCNICSRKVKMTRSIAIGEDDYCEPCFRRQYLLRSAIEHFMVPSIQECTIDVPVNKRATKFVSARKTMPNVNLRGLEPVEVRYAQDEFKKFDMENNGWITKAVLYPLMKACFSYGLRDRELKTLLSSHALKSMITSFGIDEREEVHEIEFLSLLAFIARERQRLRTANNPHAKFTSSDLDMAYAFRNQFVAQKKQPQPPGPSGNTANPLHTQPGALNQQQSLSQITKSLTDSALETNHRRMSTLQASPQHSNANPESNMVSPSHNPNPLFSTPAHPTSGGGGIGNRFSNPQRIVSQVPPQSRPASQYRRGQSLLSPAKSPVPLAFPSASVGGGGALNFSKTSAAFTDLSLHQGDLPEEDQEDNEMPSLPPEKDPSARTLHNPLLGKRPANSKQMMEELKLTGGSADAWMLY